MTVAPSYAGIHLPHQHAFTYQNGANVPRIPVDDYTQDASGIVVGRVAELGPRIIAFKGNSAPKPLAFIIQSTLEMIAEEDTAMEILHCYRCSQIQLAVAAKLGDTPKTQDYVMVNMGPQDIIYNEKCFNSTLKMP